MDQAPGQPRIAFWVSGGGQKGLGHVIRSLAIASHLRSKSNAWIFFRSNPDPAVHRLIEAKEFPLDGRDQITSNAENLEPSAWMVDVHDGGSSIVRELRHGWPGANLMAMDFNDFKSDCPDTIINLRNTNPDRATPPEWVEYHEGLEYTVIRDEFMPYRDSTRWDGDLSDILVCFGSSDVGNNTRMVLAGAALASLPNTTYHVVIGPNVAHRDALLREVDQSTLSVQVHEQPPNLPGLMASCGLAFCGGGTTMMELAYLGVPSVGIGQTELEEGLARLLEQHGTLTCAGKAGTCRPEDIVAILGSLKSQPERLGAMAQNGRKLIDGKGIERIASLIQGCAATG